MKSLEALKFDKIRSKKQSRRSQTTAFGAGKIQILKREVVSSMENVGDKRLSTWKECWSWDWFLSTYFLCINNSFPKEKRVANRLYRILRTLEEPMQEKKVINNACKRLVGPPLFLMHLHLHFFFSLSLCNFKLNVLKPVERRHTVSSRSLSNLQTRWTHTNKMHNMS